MQYVYTRGASMPHPGYSPEKALLFVNAIFLRKMRLSATTRLQPWRKLFFYTNAIFPHNRRFSSKPRDGTTCTRDLQCREINTGFCRKEINENRSLTGNLEIAIYAPMIYIAPCVMLLMRADTLQGQVGGCWALQIESFQGPVKWHRADRRVPFGAQKTSIYWYTHLAKSWQFWSLPPVRWCTVLTSSK